MSLNEGYKNTSGELKETKYKGGDESMYFRENITRKRKRNRETGIKN